MMAKMGRPVTKLVVTEAERAELRARLAVRKAPADEKLRIRIVLACAQGESGTRIAERGTDPGDLQRLQRWSGEVQGRGACKHPDGAVMFLLSAMKTFGDDFAHHPAHLRRSA